MVIANHSTDPNHCWGQGIYMCGINCNNPEHHHEEEIVKVNISLSSKTEIKEDKKIDIPIVETMIKVADKAEEVRQAKRRKAFTTKEDFNRRLIEKGIPVEMTSEYIDMRYVSQFRCLNENCKHCWLAITNNVWQRASKCEMCDDKRTTEEYENNYLKGTNIGVMEEYAGFKVPIKHYCKNEGCVAELVISPCNMIARINKCDNKMMCCEECKIKEIKSITHKVCTGPCRRYLPIDDFATEKNNISGKSCICKMCRKEHQKLWAREWRKNNPEESKRKKKEYDEKNKDRNRSYHKKKNQQQGVKDRRNKRNRERLKTDINYKIIRRLRRSFLSALDTNSKNGRHVKDLLCMPIENFKKLIESMFTEGMTWDNIHMDHYIPVNNFNHSDPEQVKMCWHWSNFRPMFGYDNQSKTDTLPDDFIEGTWKWQGSEIGWADFNYVS